MRLNNSPASRYLHVFHSSLPHTLLKMWNLCWQLNLLTFVTLPPFYLRMERHWEEEPSRLRGERSTQTTHFKCEGTRWMALAAKWRQRVFTSQGIPKSFLLPSMYNEFVLLLLFSLSLRKTFSMGALIVSVLCWSCEFSVVGLAMGLAIWHLSRDYLCKFFVFVRHLPQPTPGCHDFGNWH